MAKTKTRYVPIRMDNETHTRLVVLANETASTVSELIREAVRQFLESYGAA